MASSTKKRIRSSSESVTTMQHAIEKSERKTRSKRQKENCEELSADINNKKHYVLYPGDNEGNNHENEVKSTRVLRRHTLKEQNMNITNPVSSESAVKKPKSTRKSKKVVEESKTDIIDVVTLETEVKPKVKKNKKKKQIVPDEVLENNDEIKKETDSNTKKKSKKRKNIKRPSSDGIEEISKNSSCNLSMESFHSAAGSLCNEKINGFDKQVQEVETETNVLNKIIQSSNKKLKPKLPKKKSSTMIEDPKDNSGIYADNLSKVTIEQKSYMNDISNKTSMTVSENTNDHNELCNGALNSTYEKPNLNISVPAVDNTNTETLITASARNSSIISLDRSSSKCSLDKTFEKCSETSPKKINSLNLTIERENSNLTLDKDEQVSSLISNTVNVTFDKSNGSLVSISSDDSRVVNLASPLFIDSSMNVSNVINTPTKQEMTEKQMPISTLKREGTYTKESTTESQDLEQSEINNSTSSNHTVSLPRTPKRRKSLPSPGCTPFTGAKSSEKGKVVLNLTHSIEKPTRRSSLVEQTTKTTKVMFCSPINNPVIASQVKRKVIKSNLKGSNKSFLYNDSLSESKRPGTRKRSFTQNDADDTQRKRVRLGDEMQQSVDRLSRPRTVSAAAKLSEPLTPSKKTATPLKSKPNVKPARTKLPNFAALHQKRFEKMESLDECQERKAKRARQLLTPTGTINLLERISPKEKVPDSPKTVMKETGKPDTPYRPKLPTLESLNPGYTRFGFKMNYAVNPFSGQAKQTEVKVKKSEPVRMKRQASQPSLAGATSVKRLEAAKHSVMREKSFTGKREAKRDECRTVIKGVRTNRRFDLQMKMRNIN